MATQAPFGLLCSIVPWEDFLGNAVAFLRKSPYIYLRSSSEEAIFLLFWYFGICLGSFATQAPFG
jgi:hypothetical protein